MHYSQLLLYNRSLFSRSDLEGDTSGTLILSPDLVANCSSTSHSENINSAARPFPPALSNEEPYNYDDYLDPLLCSTDDTDYHRTVKPPLESVYKYVSQYYYWTLTHINTNIVWETCGWQHV